MSKSRVPDRHMGQCFIGAAVQQYRRSHGLRRWIPAISISGVTALVWMTGCRADSPGPCASCPPSPPSGLIVSDPVTVATAASPRSAGVASSSGGGSDVVYVSLTPGTTPTGTRASIRRVGDLTSVTTAVVDGGFDPVPVAAQAGDTVEVTVTDAADSAVLYERALVAAARPPVVIRTDPPPRKRDVPLNANLVVVFSEPVDSSTLSSSTIQLRHGPDAVAGTVNLVTGTSTDAVFAPSTLLDPNTDYQLIVTAAVQDLSGDPLASGDTVDFTTGSTSAGPPVKVSILRPTATLLPQGQLQLSLDALVDAEGNLLTGLPISWASQDPNVATVNAGGLVTGISEGTARISATVESVSDTAIVTVVIPAPGAERIAFVRNGDIYLAAADGSFQVNLTTNAAASTSSPSPLWSPDGSRIAFGSQRDGNPEIYAMNRDGSGQVNITQNPRTDVVWGWSPDSRKIVFSSDRDGPSQVIGPFQIYVMNADGSDVTRLTHDSASDVEATWSPDGSKIAFAGCTAQNCQIYAVNADGSGEVALTSDSLANYLEPAWSPDGSRIAFSDGALHVMNADGTGATTLTNGWNPEWSPDGSKIAFHRVNHVNRALCSQTLCTISFHVINVDGSRLVPLEHNLTYGGGSGWGPSWSGDGARVAFVSAPTPGGTLELFVANADGSGLVQLTTGGATDPAWSPR